jgi:hypothetical protein
MKRRIEGLHEADPAGSVLLPDSLYLVRVARGIPTSRTTFYGSLCSGLSTSLDGPTSALDR